MPPGMCAFLLAPHIAHIVLEEHKPANGALFYTPPPIPTALGAILGSSTLAYVGVTGDKQEDDPGSQDTSTILSIGAGLPPVPLKLVKRIQAGEFIDMSELLPDHLGINAGPPLEGDKVEK